MAPDKDSIRAGIIERYQENRALIAGLTDADLARPTANPKWKVRQLAGHIAEDAGGTVYVGKLLAKGKNAKAPDVVVNLANWWSLRKYRKATVQAIVTTLDTKHQELLAWLDTLADDALSNGGEISGMGRLSLAEFLVQNSAHSRENGDEIRAALTGKPAGAPAAMEGNVS